MPGYKLLMDCKVRRSFVLQEEAPSAMQPPSPRDLGVSPSALCVTMGSQVRTVCFSWRDEFKGEADCRHKFIAVGLLYPWGAYFSVILFISIHNSPLVFQKFLLAKFSVVLLRAALSFSDEQ